MYDELIREILDLSSSEERGSQVLPLLKGVEVHIDEGVVSFQFPLKDTRWKDFLEALDRNGVDYTKKPGIERTIWVHP